MRKNSNKKLLGKKQYSIIVDGQTEIWYLQLMKKHENLKHINIKPEIPKKKKLKEQFELVKENAKHYDKVFWLLDFDVFIKEEKEKRQGKRSKITELKNYFNKFKEKDNIEVFFNNPCLEYWFLLHYNNTNKYFEKCINAERELKKKGLSDYQKTEKYFKKSNNDIYKKLKNHQEFAISNAIKLGDFNFNNVELAKTEIYKLIEKLTK